MKKTTTLKQMINMSETIKCKDCWWFLYNSEKSLEKGQCLAYGFFMDIDSEICCEYTRGKRYE